MNETKKFGMDMDVTPELIAAIEKMLGVYANPVALPDEGLDDLIKQCAIKFSIFSIAQEIEMVSVYAFASAFLCNQWKRRQTERAKAAASKEN